MTPRWKPKPASSTSRALRLKDGPHAHRCQMCGSRYEDACKEALLDGDCGPCRGGSARPVWAANRDPKPCCVASSRKATHEERQLYRLGGTSTWWICLTCKRTHPNQPKED